MSCIFCKIIKGDASGSFVYRDEVCAAFLDIHPINPGHVLVLPNEHIGSIDQLSEVTTSKMFNLAREIFKALKSSDIRMDGANIFLSNGEAAGQEVPHCHIHIVPRYSGDGQRIGFKHASGISRENLNQIAQTIKMNLQGP